MSSFGLLVSNIVSSFIIEYHTLSGLSYIIFDKNSCDFSGNGFGKARNTSENCFLVSHFRVSDIFLIIKLLERFDSRIIFGVFQGGYLIYLSQQQA